MPHPGRDSTATEDTSLSKSDTSTNVDSAASPKTTEGPQLALIRSFTIDRPCYFPMRCSCNELAPILRLIRVPLPHLRPIPSEETTYCVRAPIKRSNKGTPGGPKKREVAEAPNDKDIVIYKGGVEVAVIRPNIPSKCKVTKLSAIKSRWHSWFTSKGKSEHTQLTPPDPKVHLKNGLAWRVVRPVRNRDYPDCLFDILPVDRYHPEYVFDQVPVREPCYRLRWSIVTAEQRLAPPIGTMLGRTRRPTEQAYALTFRHANNIFVATLTRDRLDIQYVSSFAAMPGLETPSHALVLTASESRMVQLTEGVAPKMELEELYDLIVVTGVWVQCARRWSGRWPD